MVAPGRCPHPSNERRSLDAVAALPTDRERGIGFLDVDRLALALSSQPCGGLTGGVEQPGIAGFGGEQDQLTDGDDAAVVVGGAALNRRRDENSCPRRSACPRLA